MGRARARGSSRCSALPAAWPPRASSSTCGCARALRLAGRRWTGASAGGALAGLRRAALWAASPSCWPRDRPAHASVIVPLALVGALVGGLGAAGVGAGLAMAEALARSLRGLALVALGALGGATVGFAAHMLGGWTLAALFGQDLWMVGGGLEGLGPRRRRRSRLRAGDAAARTAAWPLRAAASG